MNPPYIPRIDLSPIINPNSAKDLRKDTAEKIFEALAKTGFMTVTNHGISGEELQEVFDTYKEFFDKPLVDKMSVHINDKFRGYVPLQGEQVNPNNNPDSKECFDSMLELGESDPLVINKIGLYGPNQWPSDMPEMQMIANNYYHKACILGEHILEAIAEILEVPGFFKEKFTQPSAMLRANYYPPRAEAASQKDMGIAAHSDYGCLTILAQNGVSGLEVQTQKGQWLPVEPKGNDIVVNVGEVLEKFSSGKLKATPHRVKGSSQERMSLPLFYNPNHDTPLIPIGEEFSDQQSPITTGEYIEGRYNSTYKK